MSTSQSNFVPREEAGMASLIVVIVLLALLTITVLVVSRSTVTELRTSSNENRQKEAFAAAQAGLDRGGQVFLASSSIASFNCGASLSLGSSPNTTDYCFSGSVVAGEATITGTGKSPDGTGTASVTEVYTLSGSAAYGKLVPFVASGNVPTGGGFTLIPNPNSGGEGVPVAVWSSSAGTGGVSSWDVCEYDEYISGVCTATDKSNYLCKADDEDNCPVFVQDSNVPDPFTLLFNDDVSGCFTGTGSDCPVDTRRQSYSGYFSCDSTGIQPKGGRTYEEALALAKSGIGGLPVVWVLPDDASNCSISSVGSEDEPVIVIIEGDLSISGGNGDHSYGIIFGMTDYYDPSSESAAIRATPDADNGSFELNSNGSTVHGALLINGEIKNANGNTTIAWDPSVLSKLTEAAQNGIGLARARGTWRDF